ncbi:MAG: hypothetical protein H0V17_30445, partial [Deltaproteobacteria bacterium]|nr:hypothetical protein [Deltaproteobacteria bacterium]
RSTARWTIGVLLVAAIVGAIAAFAIARGGGNDDSLPDVAPINYMPPKIELPVVAADPIEVKPPVATVTPAPPAPVDPTPVVAPEDTPPVTPTPDKTEPAPAPAPTPSPAPRPQTRSQVKKEPGILRVNSEPWSYVTVAGQRQSTVAKFSLPPGKYSVVFENKEIGRRITKSVVVESGKVVNLTANLEEDF